MGTAVDSETLGRLAALDVVVPSLWLEVGTVGGWKCGAGGRGAASAGGSGGVAALAGASLCLTIADFSMSTDESL